MLIRIQENKEFDMIKHATNNNGENVMKLFRQKTHKMRKCGTNHKPRQCLAYGRMVCSCGKVNHFQMSIDAKSQR